jgi:excisionase family DNA binding protein
VTRFELAALLHVSVRTVDRIIAAGEIPVRRVRGYAVRFLRSDVDQYLTREKLKS